MEGNSQVRNRFLHSQLLLPSVPESFKWNKKFFCLPSSPHRWLKFEEDVEDGGERWSKPYVATLSLHSLFELRSCIINGSVLLDMRASCIEEIAGDLCYENLCVSAMDYCGCGFCSRKSVGMEKLCAFYNFITYFFWSIECSSLKTCTLV